MLRSARCSPAVAKRSRPEVDKNCFGLSSPQINRVSGRRRIPSPPARTIPQRCAKLIDIFESFPFVQTLPSSEILCLTHPLQSRRTNLGPERRSKQSPCQPRILAYSIHYFHGLRIPFDLKP